MTAPDRRPVSSFWTAVGIGLLALIDLCARSYPKKKP